jgi:thiamine-monophosphate kinase
MLTLADLGEREIIREVLPRFCGSVGDDCAVVPVCEDWDLVLTTDPAPVPAAQTIAGEHDLWFMGWLAATINASDLAAAGAAPVAFLAAIEAPREMPMSDFERLLAGIRDACAEEKLPYVGGNLREAKQLSIVGTAVGKCRHRAALNREGASVGDMLVSIGAGGVFWRDALRATRGLPVTKEHSPLFSPRSQLRYMGDLAQTGAISAAIDNSDGLLPSATQLAVSSGVGIEVHLDALKVDDMGGLSGIDPARFWLGWGDWNVVAAVDPKRFDALKQAADSTGASVHVIGLCDSGRGVRLRRGDSVIAAPRLESERFAPDSWFATGVDSYVNRLLSVDLP